MSQIVVHEYNASPGLGINFIAKCFIITDEDQIYVISPGPIPEDQMKTLQNTNKPIFVFAPNNFHNLYLSHFKDKIPHANFFGPKQASIKSGVELKNPLDFDGKTKFTISKINGNPALSEYLFYHEATKSLILTDSIFNMHHKMDLMTRMYLTLSGTYHRLNTSYLVLLTCKNKNEFWGSLRAALQLPFENVLLNHGDAISRASYVDFIEKNS